jgi:predicted helicase
VIVGTLSRYSPKLGGQTGAELGNYRVEKMRFRRVKVKVDGKDRTVDDKSTIHYNSTITISNIPDKAYEYVVNGRSAIE